MRYNVVPLHNQANLNIHHIDEAKLYPYPRALQANLYNFQPSFIWKSFQTYFLHIFNK